jgi:hypothetical protein
MSGFVRTEINALLWNLKNYGLDGIGEAREYHVLS